MATLVNNSIRSQVDAYNGLDPNLRFRTSNGTTNAHYCHTHGNFTHQGNAGTNIIIGSGSFNVTSIFELGVGLYQCNFTESFFDLDYGIVAVAQHSRDIGDGNRIFFHVRDAQLGYIILETIGGDGATGTFRIYDAAFAIFSSSAY